MSVYASSVSCAATPTLGTVGPWAWPRPCRGEDEEGMWGHQVRGVDRLWPPWPLRWPETTVRSLAKMSHVGPASFMGLLGFGL
jgi:hypothetical protein